MVKIKFSLKQNNPNQNHKKGNGNSQVTNKISGEKMKKISCFEGGRNIYVQERPKVHINNKKWNWELGLKNYIRPIKFPSELQSSYKVLKNPENKELLNINNFEGFNDYQTYNQRPSINKKISTLHKSCCSKIHVFKEKPKSPPNTLLTSVLFKEGKPPIKYLVKVNENKCFKKKHSVPKYSSLTSKKDRILIREGMDISNLNVLNTKNNMVRIRETKCPNKLKKNSIREKKCMDEKMFSNHPNYIKRSSKTLNNRKLPVNSKFFSGISPYNVINISKVPHVKIKVAQPRYISHKKILTRNSVLQKSSKLATLPQAKVIFKEPNQKRSEINSNNDWDYIARFNIHSDLPQNPIKGVHSNKRDFNLDKKAHALAVKKTKIIKSDKYKQNYTLEPPNKSPIKTNSPEKLKFKKTKNELSGNKLWRINFKDKISKPTIDFSNYRYLNSTYATSQNHEIKTKINSNEGQTIENRKLNNSPSLNIFKNKSNNSVTQNIRLNNNSNDKISTIEKSLNDNILCDKIKTKNDSLLKEHSNCAVPALSLGFTKNEKPFSLKLSNDVSSQTNSNKFVSNGLSFINSSNPSEDSHFPDNSIHPKKNHLINNELKDVKVVIHRNGVLENFMAKSFNNELKNRAISFPFHWKYIEYVDKFKVKDSQIDILDEKDLYDLISRRNLNIKNFDLNMKSDDATKLELLDLNAKEETFLSEEASPSPHYLTDCFGRVVIKEESISSVRDQDLEKSSVSPSKGFEKISLIRAFDETTKNDSEDVVTNCAKTLQRSVSPPNTRLKTKLNNPSNTLTKKTKRKSSKSPSDIIYSKSSHLREKKLPNKLKAISDNRSGGSTANTHRTRRKQKHLQNNKKSNTKVQKIYDCTQCPFTSNSQIKFLKHSHIYKRKDGSKSVADINGKSHLPLKSRTQSVHKKPTSEFYKAGRHKKEALDPHTSQNSNSQNKKSYKCPQCKKLFLYLKSFKSHLSNHRKQKHSRKIHLNISELACPLCTVKFSNYIDLKSHCLNHSQDYIDEIFCSLCGFQLKTLVGFLSHTRRHLRMKKRYLCSYCNHSFVTELWYKKHMKRHAKFRMDKGGKNCNGMSEKAKQKLKKGQIQSKYNMPLLERKTSKKSVVDYQTQQYFMQTHSSKEDLHENSPVNANLILNISEGSEILGYFNANENSQILKPCIKESIVLKNDCEDEDFDEQSLVGESIIIIDRPSQSISLDNQILKNEKHYIPESSNIIIEEKSRDKLIKFNEPLLNACDSSNRTLVLSEEKIEPVGLKISNIINEKIQNDNIEAELAESPNFTMKQKSNINDEFENPEGNILNTFKQLEKQAYNMDTAKEKDEFGLDFSSILFEINEQNDEIGMTDGEILEADINKVNVIPKEGDQSSENYKHYSMAHSSDKKINLSTQNKELSIDNQSNCSDTFKLSINNEIHKSLNNEFHENVDSKLFCESSKIGEYKSVNRPKENKKITLDCTNIVNNYDEDKISGNAPIDSHLKLISINTEEKKYIGSKLQSKIDVPDDQKRLGEPSIKEESNKCDGKVTSNSETLLNEYELQEKRIVLGEKLREINDLDNLNELKEMDNEKAVSHELYETKIPNESNECSHVCVPNEDEELVRPKINATEKELNEKDDYKLKEIGNSNPENVLKVSVLGKENKMRNNKNDGECTSEIAIPYNNDNLDEINKLNRKHIFDEGNETNTVAEAIVPDLKGLPNEVGILDDVNNPEKTFIHDIENILSKVIVAEDINKSSHHNTNVSNENPLGESEHSKCISPKKRNICSFKCNFCQFKTDKLFLLNEHLKDHGNERSFECSFCPLTFPDSSLLKLHIKEHNE